MHFAKALCTHLAVLRFILQKLYMMKEILGPLRPSLCESPVSALKLGFQCSPSQKEVSATKIKHQRYAWRVSGPARFHRDLGHIALPVQGAGQSPALEDIKAGGGVGVQCIN